jgi:hypothetical protein
MSQWNSVNMWTHGSDKHLFINVPKHRKECSCNSGSAYLFPDTSSTAEISQYSPAKRKTICFNMRVTESCLFSHVHICSISQCLSSAGHWKATRFWFQHWPCARSDPAQHTGIFFCNIIYSEDISWREYHYSLSSPIRPTVTAQHFLLPLPRCFIKGIIPGTFTSSRLWETRDMPL